MTETRSISTSLLLVRHGQDVDNSRSIINGRRDTPLTDIGKSQALALAGDLQSRGIDRICTSPLQRAFQTASIIADALGIEDVLIEPALIERDYGVLTGRAVSEIPTLAQEIVVSHGFRHVIRAQDIEDYAELWARAGVALRKIQAQHAGHTVLVVAHNEILRMMRAQFAQRSWQDELLLPPLTHCQLICLDTQP